MLSNDGVTDGTFIVSGGEGFRGRTEMFLSTLSGGPFLPSGDIDSLTFNGTSLVPVPGLGAVPSATWNVPLDTDSSNRLEVRFTSGLEFDMQIDIAANPEGLNTVTQTIVGARSTL